MNNIIFINKTKAEDIVYIRKKLSEKGIFIDDTKELKELYEQFSSEYCADWLVSDNETIKDFANWLYQKYIANKEVLENE